MTIFISMFDKVTSFKLKRKSSKISYEVSPIFSKKGELWLISMREFKGGKETEDSWMTERDFYNLLETLQNEGWRIDEQVL